MVMIIGVTDCSKYANYSNWILASGENLEIIQLGHHLKNFDAVKKCHGILLTGGEDVHPSLYRKPEYLPYCHPYDLNIERDEFEWKLIDFTERNKIPVLGICRGLQIANVYFGGTLIPDLPSWGKEPHSKTEAGTDRLHSVQIQGSSKLHSIVKTNSGIINSNHHQSAEEVADSLFASAHSSDGTIEALERKDQSTGAFLCLVQWHPERMEDQKSPFAANLRETFLNACK